jgi:release factor glutamine methyltransferase
MKPLPYRNAPTTSETARSQNYSVRDALREGITRLRDGKVASFTLAAEILLLHVLGRDRTWIYAHPEEIVSDEHSGRYFELIARRAAGEPTQHLTGKQEFWGLEFEVTREVLIPRPETEHVIEVALDRLALREVRAGRPNKNDGAGLRIADVGTGSGCIAVALAKELPGAEFVAVDISAAALAVARRNAEQHGVVERIELVESNLLQGLGKSDRLAQHAAPLQGVLAASAMPHFDLIVSNPPYVGRREAETLAREVREHEPETALYGGEEGYELYGELIRQAAKHLKPSGIVVLELGHNSLAAVEPLLDSAHWANVGITKDLAGIPRVIAAERASDHAANLEAKL